MVGAVGIEPLGAVQTRKLLIPRFAQIPKNRSNRVTGVRHRCTESRSFPPEVSR
jgi:hypothetical protein